MGGNVMGVIWHGTRRRALWRCSLARADELSSRNTCETTMTESLRTSSATLHHMIPEPYTPSSAGMDCFLL